MGLVSFCLQHKTQPNPKESRISVCRKRDGKRVQSLGFGWMLMVDHRLFLLRSEDSGPLTIRRLYQVFGLVNGSKPQGDLQVFFRLFFGLRYE